MYIYSIPSFSFLRGVIIVFSCPILIFRIKCCLGMLHIDVAMDGYMCCGAYCYFTGLLVFICFLVDISFHCDSVVYI